MSWLISLLTGPLFGALTKMYTARLAAQNTTDKQAADLAAQEIAGEVASRQIEASIIRQEEGRWYTALPRPILAFIFVLYIGKCVVWDTMLGWGSTPALGTEMAWAMHIVLTGYFGGRTIEKVARVFKR